MISYLVDFVLLAALLITSVRVTRMHRELRQLRGYESQLCGLTEQTSQSFNDISAIVHDLNANGAQLVHLLGFKIDEARELIVEFQRCRAQNADRAVVEADTSGGREPRAMIRNAAA
jgi:hypothetical protein